MSVHSDETESVKRIKFSEIKLKESDCSSQPDTDSKKELKPKVKSNIPSFFLKRRQNFQEETPKSLIKKSIRTTCDVCAKLSNSRHVTADGLSCCYGIIYSSQKAAMLLKECEEQIDYFTGELTKIHVFGKWHQIPRKQCAYGDPGLTYKFSGLTLPAKPWPEFLKTVRDEISELVGHRFNFVLCNRYKDGSDYIGEHKDDEIDLVNEAPIASLSLGFCRDFVLRHEDVKHKKAPEKDGNRTLKLQLQSGSLLVMNYPTNRFWYHSLPVRKTVPGVRINFTFRVLKC